MSCLVSCTAIGPRAAMRAAMSSAASSAVPADTVRCNTPGAFGGGGIQPLTCQRHELDRRRPDLADETLRAGPPRHHAHVGFGQAEYGVGAADAQVARRCELEPAAQCKTPRSRRSAEDAAAPCGRIRRGRRAPSGATCRAGRWRPRRRYRRPRRRRDGRSRSGRRRGCRRRRRCGPTASPSAVSIAGVSALSLSGRSSVMRAT